MKLLRHIYSAPIRFYRRFISPLFPAVCRFRPTCSTYALGAIERFGIIRGTWLGMLRILRCNPFCRPGFDPVPDKGWRKKYPKVPFDRIRERSNGGETPAVEQD